MSDLKLGHNQALKYTEAISLVFYDVMESDKPADRELKAFFSANKQCGSKDRKFISEGFYGLFRWYGWLKSIIPSEKPDEPIKNTLFCKALAIALNLEGLTKPLAYKALCDAAEYKSRDFSDGLHDICTELGEVIGEQLTIEMLVPSWFLGETSRADSLFFESLQKRPPVWLRAQRKGLNDISVELKRNNFDFKIHEKIPNAVKILDKINLIELKAFKKGLLEVQDLASQCLVTACDVQSGEFWWDVCAGAGGKTLAIADKLQGRGKVTATDKRKHILQEVKKRAQRGGFRSVQIGQLNKIKNSDESFDGVLVDAPCSCTGTWRRNPDARWKSNENICKEWSVIQLEILSEASTKVKPGGKLVYATCSVSSIENETVVQLFLEHFKEFELEPFVHPLTGKETNGMMWIDPLPEDCDSMFAARMIRKKK
ncbi:MAG: RsmB/NOP family class I SAM-dependent RNA methyltransferase [Lentisphaeraceae bacterium]|nr:RsmB/NOP family class I SAM-dependent RNA methyltransferase [Lentisphaeraceae bacterium]